MTRRRSASFAPLAWLVWRSTVNRGLRRARRARQPRYVLAILLGLGYFWVILLRPGRGAMLEGSPVDGTAHLAYAFGFALLAASWWLLGSDQIALNFSPAEVQLLFPAPVTRRQLVIFKLVQAQLIVLFSVLLWLVILGRPHGSVVLRAVALWLLFTTLYLHRIGASLVRESATEHGLAGARRHLGAILVFSAAACAVLTGIIAQLPLLRAHMAIGDATGAAAAALHAPIVRTVLYPFRLVLAPLFTATPREWIRAAWPAFLILGLHVVWVMRTDTAFEEAAAESATRRARAIAARMGGGRVSAAVGRRRFRLPLPAHSGPTRALIWKNTLALARTIAPRTVVAMVFILVMVVFLAHAIVPDERTAGGLATRAALYLCLMLVATGPIWVRNDLRLDLMQLELLRGFPVRGATIVRAEVGASLTLLGGLQVLLALFAYLAMPPGSVLGPKLAALSLSDRTALLVMLMIALPIASALGLLVQNAGALLFPAWMRLGLARPGGVEAIGQSILTMFGSVLGLGLLGAVPAVLGIVVGAMGAAQYGLWGAVPGALLGAALVLGELWWITGWLGRVFERTESVGEAVSEAMRY